MLEIDAVIRQCNRTNYSDGNLYFIGLLYGLYNTIYVQYGFP